MSDSFTVPSTNGGKVIRASASNPKLVIATGETAYIGPLGGLLRGGKPDPYLREGSSFESFTRRVIEEDSIVDGWATIQVVPASEG